MNLLAMVHDNNDIVRKYHKRICQRIGFWSCRPEDLHCKGISKSYLPPIREQSDTLWAVCQGSSRWEVQTSQWAVDTPYLPRTLVQPSGGDPQLHLQLLQQTRLLLPPRPYRGQLAPVPNLFQLSPEAAMDALPVGLTSRISGKCQIATLFPQATTSQPRVKWVRSLGLDWRWFGFFLTHRIGKIL